MTVAEKLAAVAENEQKVYAAGEDSAYREFWNGLTDNNGRAGYSKVFCDSGFVFLHPPFVIRPTDYQSLALTFSNSKKLKKLEAACFDFSEMTLYTAGVAAQYGAYWTFEGCESLEEVEDIGIPAIHNYTATFANCPKLHTVAVVRSADNTVFADNAFKNCQALCNLTFAGVIPGDLNLSWSPLLSVDSLMDLLDHLQDYSGTDTAKTLSIGTANQSKLTDGQIAIATQKGWTIA